MARDEIAYTRCRYASAGITETLPNDRFFLGLLLPLLPFLLPPFFPPPPPFSETNSRGRVSRTISRRISALRRSRAGGKSIGTSCGRGAPRRLPVQRDKGERDSSRKGWDTLRNYLRPTLPRRNDRKERRRALLWNIVDKAGKSNVDVNPLTSDPPVTRGCELCSYCCVRAR